MYADLYIAGKRKKINISSFFHGRHGRSAFPNFVSTAAPLLKRARHVDCVLGMGPGGLAVMRIRKSMACVLGVQGSRDRVVVSTPMTVNLWRTNGLFNSS